MSSGVSSNQKVGENASSAEIVMLPAPFRVVSKSSSGRSPYRFIQFPIDRDSGIRKERADEVFGAPRGGNQFGEDRSSHGEVPASEGGFEGSASS